MNAKTAMTTKMTLLMKTTETTETTNKRTRPGLVTWRSEARGRPLWRTRRRVGKGGPLGWSSAGLDLADDEEVVADLFAPGHPSGEPCRYAVEHGESVSLPGDS
jgi:hypothetical protein